MGTECYHVLAQLMPSLKQNQEKEAENKNHNDDDDPVPKNSEEEQSHQNPQDSGKPMVMPPHLLAIAMTCFLSTLSSPQSPTILVLDDLQWTDTDSLIILRVLLQYQQFHHLLFLGLYRDDEKEAEDVSSSSSSSSNSYARFQIWLEETTHNPDPGQALWPDP